MVIQHILCSGGRPVEIRKHIKIEGDSSRRGPGSKVSGKDVNNQVSGKMEFMYCIPDLEVFIDKTIKKCLLEYDLDANDTEAVLDDMEKAWPKSPLRSTEKHFLKDCNDNTEKATNSRPASVVNQHQEEGPPLDAAVNSTVQKEGNTDVPIERAEGVPEAGLSKKVEPADVVSNGNRYHEHMSIESYRSDTSSPDVGDRKLQTPRHPKLKSLLQQRYFEGQESTISKKEPPGRKEDGKAWNTNKHMSSNLDLLASAANIHTESANATEEHKMQAIRRLQEESEREYLFKAAKQQRDRSVLESSSPQVHRTMPVLLKLMSASSSSSLPEFINSPPRAVVSDLPGHSVKVCSPDTSQRISPNTTFLEEPRLVATLKEHEKYAPPVLNQERTQQLLQHYQNGYNAVIPTDGMVTKQEYSPSPTEGDLKLGRGPFPSSLPSSLSWDGAASRAMSSANFNHLASSSHYQNHLDRHQNPPDSFLQQFHYHGSRIANIIAEELQKDDDSQHESQFKASYHSEDRVASAEPKSSGVDEPRLTKSSLLPGHYKRAASNEAVTFPSHSSAAHTHMDMHYKAAGADKPPQIFSHSQTMPKLLPAHLAMTNTHSGGANLASHVDHATSFRKKDVVDISRVAADDNQPQDLSTKPRKGPEGVVSGHHSRGFNPALTSLDYMTVSRSPSATSLPAPHLESPAIRKSLSPCNHSNTRSPDNRSYHSIINKESNQLKTDKWDNRDPMSHLYISPARLGNSQNLTAKRTSDLVQDTSETGNVEAHKRRRLQ